MIDITSLSKNNYQYFAKTLGFILVLYGGGAIFTYLAYILTGTNSLKTMTNSMGVLFLALMGAFPLPLGFALFWAGDHTQVLLRITAVALGLNALLRLSIFMVPELLEMVQFKDPIIEFFIFGALALIATLFHPKDKTKLSS